MKQTVFHAAGSRGDANHGWLHSKHTFSFAGYHDPNRVHFGALRVLNDDTVAPRMGFGKHPHENMEIVSIPLSGDLEHQDSMGNKTIIKQGDIQVMSAGSGILHSEYNANKDKEVKFLQIWIFPKQQNVTPRYDQITLNPEDRKNTFQQILSPNANDPGVWIHQNAWFHLADFEKGKESQYQFKAKGNGLYIFVLNGTLEVEGQLLNDRDGFGIWDVASVAIKATSEASFLMMEVPMSF
ncbi:MAG TPA: pirin family protein [Edaphocola sp.]|nr:pirin family protein [Edaphocola sp.]